MSEIENKSDETIAVEWQSAHAAEIAAEEGKPFELFGGDTGELGVADTDSLPSSTASVVAVVGQPAAKAGMPPERVSTLQKIARLTVGERVKLAMTGNKEERSVLIRDGSRIVSSAVIASPKLSESEVELIAAMKNVQESVLRDIARNRKFLKNYNVVRNLVNNPRSPLDLSLTLMKNLLAQDLKTLSMNKNVPETLRKLALKSFKEKTTPNK